MAVLLFLFLASLYPFILAKSVFQSSDGCNTVSIPEKDLENILKLADRLNTFLDRNLEEGHHSLKKALTTFGVDINAAIKVNPDDPLESFLLQYQIGLHHDMKQMFYEMKQLIQGKKVPDSKHNEVSDKLSPRSTYSKSSNESSPMFKMSWPAYMGKGHYAPTDYTFRPADCSEVLVAGNTESGIYDIFPFRCQCTGPVKVFCDMDTDGGGWTIFLARENISKPVNFSQNWEEYKKGFGNPDYEYWLGNENLHILTSTRNYILRMEAMDGFGRKIWGEWNTFKIDSEENRFKLTSTHFNPKSTAYDRFAYVNANFFSTFDRDNDKHAKTNCADAYKGGWWYNACHNNNPTGAHGKQDAEGIRLSPWSRTDSNTRYATWLQLKIRPAICSSTISVARLNTHDCNFR